jgi:hypothetical protein
LWNAYNTATKGGTYTLSDDGVTWTQEAPE